MLADPAAQLRDLAKQIDRLAPDRRDPHRYFEAKGEIAEALRKLAGELRRPAPARRVLPPQRPAAAPRPGAPQARPADREPLFAGDPTAGAFMRWLILVGAVDVAFGEARRATGLTAFATKALIARFEHAGILARARLAPRGGGRGRPRVRWKVRAERLAAAGIIRGASL